MMANPSRLSERQHLADILWKTQYSTLLKYGITSYREITNLDVIGTPSVWVANRPDSITISVTSGKNKDRKMALAGSLTEAMEFWAAENPNGEYTVCSYNQLKKEKQLCELLPFEDYPWAANNVVDQDTPIPWESATPVTNFVDVQEIRGTPRIFCTSTNSLTGVALSQGIGVSWSTTLSAAQG